MMLIEMNAREKWCPFVRSVPSLAGTTGAPSVDYAAHNRIQSRSDDDLPVWTDAHLCVASECMAWRWFDRRAWDNPHGELTWREPDEGGIDWHEPGHSGEPEPERGHKLCARRGYCGLSGIPT